MDWKSPFTLPRVRPFEEIARIVGGIRNDNLNHLSGEKTYYLMHQLAELEQALVRYTIDFLADKGFSLVSVPDLLHPEVVERCGFPVREERTQIYRLDPAFYGQQVGAFA